MTGYIKLIMVHVGLLSAAVSCEKNGLDVLSEDGKLVLTTEEQSKVAGENRFALQMMDKLSDDLSEGENLFFSPLSVSTALAMTSNGAKGTTKEEISKVLQSDGLSEDVVNSYYGKLLKALPLLDEETEVNLANSIWYRNDFKVLDGFLKTNKTYFHADIEGLDFSGLGAKDRINSWVDNKTNSKIPTIIDQIPDDAVMYLINAIYFKGQWEHPFEKSSTQQGDFKRTNGTAVQVDFMSADRHYEVSEGDIYDAVLMPYTEGKFDMIAVKPKEGVHVSTLLQTLNASNALNDLWTQFNSRKTKLYFPKFKMTYEAGLNETLKALGMKTAFSDAADFSGINGSGQLKIDEVKHKAFVEVDEEGTEAAAATSIGISVTSVVQPYILRFDEPFLFFIREASSGLILFAGQVNDPTREETKK